MCDKAVDDCLSTLIFVPNWFVLGKMLEKLHDALFTNDHIILFDEDFATEIFC